MRYKKSSHKEAGYLLLESLLTMTILMIVITILCPLAVNWVSKHRETKSLVEENRQLYESSLILKHGQTEDLKNAEDIIQIDKYRMQIKPTGTEVVIYETRFKE